MADIFTARVRDILSRIPAGRVITYGLVASRAGNRAGARQVARILHSSSDKYDLPWHRVINREGKISLPPGGGFELQKQLLEEEGILFEKDGSIDLDTFLWPANDPLPSSSWNHAEDHLP